MLDMTHRYKLKEDIVLKGLNNKYWALSTTTGNQYKLNEVAYDILNELTEAKSINELVDAITKAYEISKHEFISDCNALIENALKSGLVKEVNT